MFATNEEIEALTKCRTVAAQASWFERRKAKVFINAVGELKVPQTILESLWGRKFPLIFDEFDEIVNARVARHTYNIDRKATGIYLLRKGNEIVYVGQTTNFFVRAAAHAANVDFDFDLISFTPIPKARLNFFERELIARLCPRYNIMHNTFDEPLSKSA